MATIAVLSVVCRLDGTPTRHLAPRGEGAVFSQRAVKRTEAFLSTTYNILQVVRQCPVFTRQAQTRTWGTLFLQQYLFYTRPPRTPHNAEVWHRRIHTRSAYVRCGCSDCVVLCTKYDIVQ